MEHHYFPVELHQLAARIAYKDLNEGEFEIAGLRVQAQCMNHPSPTLGYRLEGDGGCVCYLSDHELYSETLWREDAEPCRLESILNKGDLHHAKFMVGADVVIHEAQYTPEEYPAKRTWGHSTFAYAVALAATAGVRRLFLTHHDPSHDDAFIANIEERARKLARELGSKIQVSCAYEGCEIEVLRAGEATPYAS